MARSRGAVVGGCLGAALVGVALLGGPSNDGPPLDPRSDGPLGTSAMVDLLRGVGSRVELSVGLPGADDDVALLLRDRLDAGQLDQLRSWVSEGGTLVVTDPASGITPPAELAGPLEGDGPLLREVCTIDALADVVEVDGGAAARYATDGTTGSCLGSEGSAFVVTTSVGAGDVVAVGGAAFVTNERLGRRDNAILAVALLAPRPGLTVRIVDAPIPAGGGDTDLYDLVSDGVRRLGLQLGIAFVVYAVWRAIRFGRPVVESQPVEIAGAELVSATGRLLERARAPGPAAEVLRADLRRALCTRFGLAPDGSADDLVALVARRSALDPAVARSAVSVDPVTTDAELVAVARAVASVHQEVLR